MDKKNLVRVTRKSLVDVFFLKILVEYHVNKLKILNHLLRSINNSAKSQKNP